jgi:transcriptional regulator with XRE-family HTH domain
VGAWAAPGSPTAHIPVSPTRLAPPLADFTAETRRLMAVRGMSLRGLARKAGVDPSDLSKMLRGTKAPTPAIMERIDTALQAGGAIRDADPGRISSADPRIPRRRLSAPDAQAILTTLAMFRDLDNRAGGGHAHALIAAYLERSVTPMLRNGTYTETDGRLLFAAAAQVAHLAAWTAYDNGDAKPAERYFARSLELAAAAGDSAFTGEVLAARSHHAIHLGRPDRAIELARAARHAACGADVPALLAEAWELEANGHAITGDRGTCAQSLAACDREHQRADETNTPAWLCYLDTAYLAARKAHTLRDLGDWTAAREHAAEATTMSGTLARARVFNTLIFASAWVQQDRDAAIGAGREALAMTAGIQSGRANAYTRDLRKRLRRRYGSGDTEVAAFDEECRQLLGTGS